MTDRYSGTERNASTQKLMLRAPATRNGKRHGFSARGAFRFFRISIRLEASNCIAETVIGQDVQQPCKRPLPKTD